MFLEFVFQRLGIGSFFRDELVRRPVSGAGFGAGLCCDGSQAKAENRGDMVKLPG
jgi:hypothetical protein